MNEDLPYQAEYAKSGRSKCKGCKCCIENGDLRLAIMVQSAFHDGKQANWFHFNCFFKRHHPLSEGDFKNIEYLRFEDQNRIKKEISKRGSDVVLPSERQGKKRPIEDRNANLIIKNYGIEYSKSARAKCHGCQLKINKDDIRVKKTVFDTEIGIKFGGQPLWHHLECFIQCRNDLGWFETGEKLPGFTSLSKEDQKNVKSQIPALKMEDIPLPSKKIKEEPKDEADLETERKLVRKIKRQTETVFDFRDRIESEMKTYDIIALLCYNKQNPVPEKIKSVDIVADMLAFGALLPCRKCKGQLIFSRSGYLCTGEQDWSKCMNLESDPVRIECIIPEELKEKYPFLASYKCKVSKRIIKYVPPSTKTLIASVKSENKNELAEPKVKREKPPLYNFAIALIGLAKQEDELKKKISRLGGKVVSKINEKTIVVLSTPEEVKNMRSKMMKAKECGVHVVSVDYLDAVKENPSDAVSFITSKSICDWGTDPRNRLPVEESKPTSENRYTKSVPKSMKLKVKDGLAVDPDSGLEDVAHVVVTKSATYSVILGLTDIQANKNSYYKLQILKSDKKDKYWLFRSWGRIGTTIGGNKLEKYECLMNAVEEFTRLYMEKTGNCFSNHHAFVKKPGKMYPIDIDYGDMEISNVFDKKCEIESKLAKPVQDLIKLIFDIDAMKKIMLEFDLDMEKMPLGKLSEKQIHSAYKVLTELSNLIEHGGSNSQFIDATNRFYTLIPHNFGINNPPIIDTSEEIKKHSEMLDSLMEIECAYKMVSSSKVSDNINPVDQYYEKLKAKIEPIDKSSAEFQLLQKYVQNTHAETHSNYELEIVDVFKVVRQGDLRRFKPFKKLHNRKLLWHGSRLTNFAGILSHGLKIAPPEAPVTGYMFGKGIYFADMVSKSANYCCTSSENSTGLVLLSEVALGDMLEYKDAHYVTSLPNKRHSVKGVGKTQPNPEETYVREDGVEIPLGKPITDKKMKSSLLYNEYIVYDVAQVNIQYLLRLDFKYKY